MTEVVKPLGDFCPKVLLEFFVKAEEVFRGFAYSGLLMISQELAKFNFAYATYLIKLARYNGLGQSWYFHVFERMVYAATCPHVVRSHA